MAIVICIDQIPRAFTIILLAPMLWYRCSGELVLKYSGLLVLGFSPAGSLFRRWARYQGSALLVGDVVGTDPSLEQVVVA